MKQILLLLLLASFCAGVTLAGGIPSGVPNMMSYQGLLTTASGAPVADGSYNLKFELFYFAGGGSAIWTETQLGISVQRGTFNVLLGALVSLPDIFNAPLYLQVTAIAGPGIGAPVTFSPRSTLASAPYSLGLKMPFTSYVALPGTGFSVWNYGTGSAIAGYYGSGSGTTAAISGQTNSTTGSATALEGIVSSTTPGGFSTAVRGQNNGTGGLGIGVWGSQNGSGWGVYGNTPSGLGVFGNSGSGYGIYGSSTSGTGIYAYSNSGYGILCYNKFAVTGTTGDTSVQLPNNAISSAEILDEPGVANSVSPTFFVYPTVGGLIAVDSVDITAPTDVYVEVTGGCYLNLWHDNTSMTELWVSIDEARANASYSIVGSIVASIPGDLPTGLYQQGGTVSRFYTVSAGTHRYYLNARYVSGTNASLNIANPYIRAIFYPTLYGTASFATPVAQYDGSRNASDGTGAPVAQSIRTITMEEHNAQLEAKVAAVRAELEARIQKLEQLVGKTEPSQQIQQQPPQQH